jgi:hypothetical protein
MAITLTTLNGTDSIASSRITINDNFSTISSSLNSLLSIIDIATGYFDNTGYGSNSNIKTENLTVTGSSGLTVSSGSITLSTGNFVLGGYVQFGSGTNIRIKTNTKSLSGGGNVKALDVSGATTYNGNGDLGYLAIPRKPTSFLNTIQGPELGSIVYDTTTNQLKVCTSSPSTGTTGVWTVVGTQS